MSVEQRLEELRITLPEAAAPVASYVPVVVHGGMASFVAFSVLWMTIFGLGLL